jgi:hypothetical protein
MTLDNTISVIEDLQKNKDKIILNLVSEYDDFVIGLNQAQLYDDGIRNDGSQITPPYAISTLRIKRKKRQPTDRVTLKDTGDFYDSFYIELGSNSFLINARDSITNILKGRYKDEILGLTEESKDELSQFLKGKLIEQLRNELQQS